MSAHREVPMSLDIHQACQRDQPGVLAPLSGVVNAAWRASPRTSAGRGRYGERGSPAVRSAVCAGAVRYRAKASPA